MRFKEVLAAVKDEAQKVIDITEEKRQLLANQNLVLEKQVEERTHELKHSLETLKSTQSQLIQSEKMASLGLSNPRKWLLLENSRPVLLTKFKTL